MTDASRPRPQPSRPPDGDVLIAAFCAAADEISPVRLDARAIGVEAIRVNRSQAQVALAFVAMVRTRPGHPNPFYTDRHTHAVFVSPSGRRLHEETSDVTPVETLGGYDGEAPITHRLVVDLSHIEFEESGDYAMTVTCPDGGTVIRHLTIEGGQ